MITAEELLKMMQKSNHESNYKLGKIDPAYTSGRPRIIFDGENIPSEKGYLRLESYTPKGGDRVLLAKVAGTYIVLGKVI